HFDIQVMQKIKCQIPKCQIQPLKAKKNGTKRENQNNISKRERSYCPNKLPRNTMRQIIIQLTLALMVVFSGHQALAASYYFSQSTGDDSRSAAQAQHPDTPWKSIDKLNAVFHTLKPGDVVYFKRGDVFYGTIEVTKSGSPGNPIVFDAYGTGAKPVITSLITLKNWKAKGSGIYESSDSRL